ncbi:unnamed protein product [Symbiodinium sp. CCMP2456]|nr:unnamed protein product [Symbiodinium sp. CCMP2456]
MRSLLSVLWAPWSSWNARRLDGPLQPPSGSVDFGFIQRARVCENSRDLRASASVSLPQGTLEECARAVAGPGITGGLCASSGYFQFRDHPGGGCHCARDDCITRQTDSAWSIYLVSQTAAPVGFRKMQEGKHCSNHLNLRAVAGRWTRGTLKACLLLVASRGTEYGCKSEYFHYRATNGDCGCAIDTCDAQTSNVLWTIYVVEKGATATPLVPMPSPVYSLVQEGHHCSSYLNLRVAGLWPGSGSLEECRQLAVGAGVDAGCSGSFFQYASNEDCGCARDNCNEKTEESNWAIYKSTAPHLWKMGVHCRDYVNLQSFSLWSVPGSLESCRVLAAARTGNECAGTYFQYASNIGDCGCATMISGGDCQDLTPDMNWDIYILNVVPTASAGSGFGMGSLRFTLGLVIAFLTL